MNSKVWKVASSLYLYLENHYYIADAATSGSHSLCVLLFFSPFSRFDYRILIDISYQHLPLIQLASVRVFVIRSALKLNRESSNQT